MGWCSSGSSLISKGTARSLTMQKNRNVGQIGAKDGNILFVHESMDHQLNYALVESSRRRGSWQEDLELTLTMASSLSVIEDLSLSRVVCHERVCMGLLHIARPSSTALTQSSETQYL